MTFDPYLVWQLNNWDDHDGLLAYADVFMQKILILRKGLFWQSF